LIDENDFRMQGLADDVIDGAHVVCNA